MMKYIKSSRIYFEEGIQDGYLIESEGKIIGFLDKSAKVENYHDYQDNRIIPGIFDTHNHGTYGYDLDEFKENDELAKENIRSYLLALAYDGVTSVLATTSETIRQVAEVAKEPIKGARVLGIHSEGPYYSRVGEKGRQIEHPKISLTHIQKMIDDGQGMLKLVAIAPELEHFKETAQKFIKSGSKIAFAHSDLKSEGAKKAVDQGVSVSTHTANVMVGLHHRDIGGLGVMLMDDRVVCEIICDGIHVCLDFIEIMFKIKDYSKFMIISDCTAFNGKAPGRYNTGWVTPINVTQEGFVIDDDGRLMGSSKPVLYGIYNLVEKLQIPMEEVIKMTSLNPMKNYGFDSIKGSIKIGKDADFVVISDDYQALATYVEGKKVFDSQTDKRMFNPKATF